MIYAGIGSRRTPASMLVFMTDIAKYLSEWTLRSGGCVGPDQAFERGAVKKEIFLAHHATEQSIQLAAQYHPAWDRCSDYARKLHGRNMMIMLGQNLDTPVKMVICYTPGGQMTGGTAQALRVALDKGIRVYNLGKQEDYHRIKEKVG